MRFHWAVAIFLLATMHSGSEAVAGCDCLCMEADGTVRGKYTFPDVPDPNVYPDQCRQSCRQHIPFPLEPWGSCMHVGFPQYSVDLCTRKVRPSSGTVTTAVTLGTTTNDKLKWACVPLPPGKKEFDIWCEVGEDRTRDANPRLPDQHCYGAGPSGCTGEPGGDIGWVERSGVKFNTRFLPEPNLCVVVENQHTTDVRYFHIWVAPR